jgi:hypothetical protein
VTEHHLPAAQPMFFSLTMKPVLFALAVSLALCVAVALTLMSRFRLRMLRFVTLIPVVLAVGGVLRFGTRAIDQTLSARQLAVELAAVETHELPVAVCGVSRELEYGLAFYRNQTIAHCESGPIPDGEHLLVVSSAGKDNVAKQTAGRRVSFLGHYVPQGVDYYWVAAAKP